MVIPSFQQNLVQTSPGASSDSELSVDIPSADIDGGFVPNIVSLQSTSRPGCIVELTSINDATQVSMPVVLVLQCFNISCLTMHEHLVAECCLTRFFLTAN
jgi:hypothetical protein